VASQQTLKRTKKNDHTPDVSHGSVTIKKASTDPGPHAIFKVNREDQVSSNKMEEEDTITVDIPTSLQIIAAEATADGRPFPNCWLSIFPWLVYMEKENHMQVLLNKKNGQ
jgi:hypothetical protein